MRIPTTQNIYMYVVQKAQWLYVLIYASHLVCLQDIAENGADVAHLTYLHGAGVSSGAGMDYRELLSGKLHTHSWTARWESLPKPSTYVGRMTLTMTNSILGVNFKSLDITSIADQVCSNLT